MYLYLSSLWPVLYILLNQTDIINNKTNFQMNKKEKTNIQINRNIISAIHSVGCSITSILAYYTGSQMITSGVIYYSISYFIWDSYYIIIYRDKYPFIIHHVIAIYVLRLILTGYHSQLLLFLVALGEISNFPYYLVYHKLKTLNKNDSSLKLWRHIQICWFILIRFIVFGYYASVFIYTIDNYLLLSLSYIMFFLGIYWGIGQVRGIYKDYYSITKQS